MKPTTERKILRWVHVILSIPILGYIYGPLVDKPYPALATKFVFIPIVILSGLWMWKGQSIQKRLKSKQRDLSNDKFLDREMFRS